MIARVFLLWMLMTSGAPGFAQTLIEAESALETRQMRGGDATPDPKLTAFGAACLGNDWGRTRGDWAEYQIEAPGGPAVFYLRYARQPLNEAIKASPRLMVRLDDKTQTLALPSTGGWELWRWIEVPLGAVVAGRHTLRLEALDEGAPLNLDALMVAPQGQTPPHVARQLLFDGSRHIRIQLSPGVAPLQQDKLFAIAEATYTFLKDLLGEEPSQRLTVHVIAPAEQKNRFVGHSIGYSLYLEEAHILDTSHNWVHEMTHCFQREAGPWPTWLSEGEAWLTYYQAETALFGRPPAAIRLTPAFYRERLPQAKAALLVDNRNLLQAWGSAGFPAEKIGAAYLFANYILGELHERCGPDLMRRYRALLREDTLKARASGVRAGTLTPEQRDAVVVERLGRAAGQNLRPLFEGWGFSLAPPHRP